MTPDSVLRGKDKIIILESIHLPLATQSKKLDALLYNIDRKKDQPILFPINDRIEVTKAIKVSCPFYF